MTHKSEGYIREFWNAVIWVAAVTGVTLLAIVLLMFFALVFL
jgi:hypothetical protein